MKKKLLISHFGILFFSIVLFGCESDSTIITPSYGSFQGSWNYTFRIDGGIQTGTYNLLSDGNVTCSGNNCTENNPDYQFVSRSWKQTVNDLEITLKYIEISNNSQINGNFVGMYENENLLNGTLSYSNGTTGTWTATRTN